MIKLRELAGLSTIDAELFLAANALHEDVPKPVPTLAELVENTSGHRVIVIEALWDGDSSGWCVDLWACCRGPTDESPTYDRRVASLRGAGGDFRLFRGEAPPWSEAQTAAELGAALAAQLGVPFHFPSPRYPEDDCPRWAERHLASPCSVCGLALLQQESVPWKGQCYQCHLGHR